MDLMEMRQQILFGIPSLMSRPVQRECDPFKVAEERPKLWQIHHPVKTASLLADHQAYKRYPEGNTIIDPITLTIRWWEIAAGNESQNWVF
jgi:hypothetical protein